MSTVSLATTSPPPPAAPPPAAPPTPMSPIMISVWVLVGVLSLGALGFLVYLFYKSCLLAYKEARQPSSPKSVSAERFKESEKIELEKLRAADELEKLRAADMTLLKMPPGDV